MKKLLLSSTAALALSATLALASPFTDQIVAGLQNQGFERIEIRNGLTQTKVEAIRGETKFEIIYDNLTGAVIEQETQPVDRGDDRSPGVFERDEDRDFSENDKSDDIGVGDDSPDDNSDDDNGQNSNDDDDGVGTDDTSDDSGDDDSGDDDSGDDNSGDDDSGDDDSGDDNSGDQSEVD